MKPASSPAESNRKTFPFDGFEQSFSVPFDYPVYFTRDLFHPRNGLLVSVIERRDPHHCHRVKVFVDSGLVDATPGMPEKIEAYIKGRPDLVEMAGEVEIVPGGEKAKNGWDSANGVMDSMAGSHLCRQSFVLAIGGGSVLDAVGLAASLVHRGLRLVRIPTTVLAQNDAGVGVKNGINDRGMKNFAGTFAPPFAVLIDYDFLRTLTPTEWIGGLAEAFKVAIIKDRDFFAYLRRHAARLRERDDSAMEATVKRCAILHLEHIRTGGDPFEFGEARPLDFGHWSAHRLEVSSGYEIGHGQAVSIGIALDSFYASQVGLISLRERDAILDALSEAGLPLWSDLLERRTSGDGLQILQGLEDFREHLGGELTVTLPDGIGQRVEVHEMAPALVEKAVADLKRRSVQNR